MRRGHVTSRNGKILIVTINRLISLLPSAQKDQGASKLETLTQYFNKH